MSEVMGALAAVLVMIVYLGTLRTILLLLCALVYYIIQYKQRWFYVAIKTAPRDLRALYGYFKIMWLSRVMARKNLSIPDAFHETVQKHPNKACFLFNDELWTFKEVEDYSLRVSAVMRKQGIRKGDVVGLLVNNSPQLPATWLGNARLGAITPLINTNQRGGALVHSIDVAKCNVLVFSEEYETAVKDVLSELSCSIKLLKLTHRRINPSGTDRAGGDAIDDLSDLLDATTPEPWSRAAGDGFSGKLLYIYTSGTTGLPKAAVISNSRFVFMASGIHYMCLGPSDVVYCPLPLYHTAGGVISVGQALLFGCTVVIKSKFSASQYFPDCLKYKATAAHYIGEMCRYVLATAPAAADTQHSVRVMYGNGLRPQIWDEFVARFNIKMVAEFYGATEGNANIVNTDGTPGAIGFVSRIIPQVYPIAIIKVDEETGEPVRNARGLCELASPDEPGAFIGKILADNPAREYLGYVDKDASEKKVVRDVFVKGDAAFISGDILVADELGYLYFRDRTGDTYRWRGENVSTSEVEAAISRVADHRDAVVYGVEVPHCEGRAGMCGLVDADGSLDLRRLASLLARDLPAYARPVFLRVMTSVDLTGTFKMKKTDLQKDGFNPRLVKNDKLYYLDPKQGTYRPLADADYSAIVAGQIRL